MRMGPWPAQAGGTVSINVQPQGKENFSCTQCFVVHKTLWWIYYLSWTLKLWGEWNEYPSLVGGGNWFQRLSYSRAFSEKLKISRSTVFVSSHPKGDRHHPLLRSREWPQELSSFLANSSYYPYASRSRVTGKQERPQLWGKWGEVIIAVKYNKQAPHSSSQQNTVCFKSLVRRASRETLNQSLLSSLVFSFELLSIVQSDSVVWFVLANLKFRSHWSEASLLCSVNPGWASVVAAQPRPPWATPVRQARVSLKRIGLCAPGEPFGP